jgi:Cu+-exporting ATPase
MAGTGVAARHGILIKDAEALEVAHAVKVVAFDKTGTLTVGKPELVEALPAEGDRSALLSLGASLQAGSEHPLARAVPDAAAREGVSVRAAGQVRAVPGHGVAARVDGRELRLGSTRWMRELKVDVGEVMQQHATRLQAQGRTVSWLADVTATPRVLGLLAFGDTLKPTALEAVRRLHAQHVRTVLVSGDNRGSAEAIGAQLGIDEVRAEVPPQHKAAIVGELRALPAPGQPEPGSAEGRVARPGRIDSRGAGGVRVAMVGDGINDAPALAAADVGIAMGTGTDVAMHAAGVTLMRGDPALVADAIDISRRTTSKIRQNLFWAFAYNVVGIPLAALGLLSPVIAGAAMAFSSFSVVTNALTLRRWRPGSTP